MISAASLIIFIHASVVTVMHSLQLSNAVTFGLVCSAVINKLDTTTNNTILTMETIHSFYLSLLSKTINNVIELKITVTTLIYCILNIMQPLCLLASRIIAKSQQVVGRGGKRWEGAGLRGG